MMNNQTTTTTNNHHHYNNEAEQQQQQEQQHNRIISHFDLDAFYVACERELNPLLIGVPVAVSQYNPHGTLVQTDARDVQKRLVAYPGKVEKKEEKFECAIGGGGRGGGENVPSVAATMCGDGEMNNTSFCSRNDNGSMIAVSYEARAAGVQRGDRGRDAVKKCPRLHIVQVPVKWGKADLTMYRNASARIMDELVSSILSLEHEDQNSSTTTTTTTTTNNNNNTNNNNRRNIKVEKASIDEIYIDMTYIVKDMTKEIVQYKNWLIQPNNKKNRVSSSSSSSSQKETNIDIDVGRRIWSIVLRYALGIGCTTIAGIETMSKGVEASHALSKNEVRKGSHLQLEDTTTTHNTTTNTTNTTTTTASTNSNKIKDGNNFILDTGSKTWWNRDLIHWSTMEISLACGAALVAKARNIVSKHFRHTSGDIFTLSAGISSNKTLAKLASGLKKPNRQTIINPHDDHALSTLFHPLPINRLRGLGGKFGVKVSNVLSVKTVGDLAKVPLRTIEMAFPSSVSSGNIPSRMKDDPLSNGTAQYLFDIARGICSEEVANRTMEKSMSSGKTFRRNLAFQVSDTAKVNFWLEELTTSLIENRLKMDQVENKRRPTLLVLSTKLNDVKSQSISRSMKIGHKYDDYLPTATKLYTQIPKKKQDKIMGLTISATSFVNIEVGESSILTAFQRTNAINTHKPLDEEESNNIVRKSSKPTVMKRKRSQITSFLPKSTTTAASTPIDSPKSDDTIKIKPANERSTQPNSQPQEAKLQDTHNGDRIDQSKEMEHNESFDKGEGSECNEYISTSPIPQDQADVIQTNDKNGSPEDGSEEVNNSCILPDNLDMEVFSQLPLTIQAEIQYHRKNNMKKKQGSVMKKWLSSNSSEQCTQESNNEQHRNGPKRGFKMETAGGQQHNKKKIDCYFSLRKKGKSK